MMTEVKNANSFQIIEIPSDWEASKLDNVINEMTDYVAAGSFESLRNNVNVMEGTGFAYYVRLTDLRLGLGHQEQKYVDEKSYVFLRKSNLFGNEVLMANIGANVGETWLMPIINKPATIAPNMIVVKVDNNKLLPDFLFYYTHSPIGFSKLEELISGSGHPKINKGELKKLIIPIPPLPEQKAIANVLSIADTAIHTTEKIIAQKELGKKWLIQQLLTGKKRLKGFGGEWKKIGAGEIFKSITKKGFADEELLSATQDRGMIPRTMLEGRVTMPTSGTEGFKLVEIGDFIISLRSFQGGLEYSNYRGLVSPAYTVLKPKKLINDEFYKQYFKSNEFIGRLATAVIGIRDGKQISYDDFCIVKIPNPALEEQTAIAKVLQAVDKEIILLKAKTEKLREQKKGLMQKLLTGKVRLKL